MPLLNVVVDLFHRDTVGANGFHDMKDAGILGIIHKATQGTHSVDPEYDDRKRRALSLDFLWGAYHFAEGGDVDVQVQHFLDTVDPDKTHLLVLDFEPNTQGSTMTLAEAEDFVTQIHDQTGRFPALYAGKSFIIEQLGKKTDTPLAQCPLWIARFGAQRPQIPPAFTDFTLWQYTDGALGPQPHKVAGVGRCDRNKFNGDESALQEFFGISTV